MTWIPIKEKSPPESGSYLVTMGTDKDFFPNEVNFVTVSYFKKAGQLRKERHSKTDKWLGTSKEINGSRVIAWQDLPLPYEEEERSTRVEEVVSVEPIVAEMPMQPKEEECSESALSATLKGLLNEHSLMPNDSKED